MPILDFSQIHTKSELMKMLGDFFRFPDYWGRNWDAFSDCIQDTNASVLPSQLQII